MAGITDSEWKYAVTRVVRPLTEEIMGAKTRRDAINLIRKRRLHSGYYGPDVPSISGSWRGLDVRSSDDSRRSLITWSELVDYVREPQQLTFFDLLEVQA